MLPEEMRLDGNAAGGALLELFARDMTAAAATCAGCGVPRPLGALLGYGGAMGIVLRCPDCDAVMLRLARTPGWLRVDASGITLLAVADGASSTMPGDAGAGAAAARFGAELPS